MSKADLLRSFDRHGIGTVRAYGYNGFRFSQYIRGEFTIRLLPDDLVYEWAD